MEFVGDANPPAGPPLAWVLLWNGMYAKFYGGYTPASIKDWGYVMWDERRWTELGEKDLVQEQWKTEPELGDEIQVGGAKVLGNDDILPRPQRCSRHTRKLSSSPKKSQGPRGRGMQERETRVHKKSQVPLVKHLKLPV